MVFFSYPCSTDVSVIVEERPCLSYLKLKSTLFAVRKTFRVPTTDIRAWSSLVILVPLMCLLFVEERPRLSYLELKSTLFVVRIHLVIH